MEMLTGSGCSPRVDPFSCLEGRTQRVERAGLGRGLNAPWSQCPRDTCRGGGAPGGRAHLTPGDVHEHGEAGGVAALAGHVRPVSGQQLTALGRPASGAPGAAERGEHVGPSTTGVSRAHLPPRSVPKTKHHCPRYGDQAPAAASDRVDTLPPPWQLARAPKQQPAKFASDVSSSSKT